MKNSVIVIPSDAGSWLSRREVKRRAVKWLRHKRPRISALLVRGDFARLRGWNEARGWEVLRVHIDGKEVGYLDQFRRGPTIFETPAGNHQVEVVGTKRHALWSDRVQFSEGGIVVVQVRPPGRRPMWTPRRDAAWWLYTIESEKETQNTSASGYGLP